MTPDIPYNVYHTALKSICALFDFNTYGGAIGSYDLGVQLPDKAVPVSVYGKILTSFTAGVGGTVSLGLRQTGNSTNFDLVSYFGNWGGTINGSAFFQGAVGTMDGFNFADAYNANPVPSGGSGALLWSVANAPVTAGAIMIYISYFESQL
jgi:hypothetical protein